MHRITRDVLLDMEEDDEEDGDVGECLASRVSAPLRARIDAGSRGGTRGCFWGEHASGRRCFWAALQPIWHLSAFSQARSSSGADAWVLGSPNRLGSICTEACLGCSLEITGSPRGSVDSVATTFGSFPSPPTGVGDFGTGRGLSGL